MPPVVRTNVARRLRIAATVVILFFILGSHFAGAESSAAYVYQDGDRILIGNGSIEATFCVSQLYAACSVRDKLHDLELIGDPEGIFALWWLQTIDDETELGDLYSASTDLESVSHTLDSSDGEATLWITWSRLFDGTGWIDVRVTVEITARDDEDFLDWRISTENGEHLTLVKVYFPLLTGITSLGDDGSDDRLAYPHLEGYLIEDPFEALTTGTGWNGFTPQGGGDWQFSSDYPGIISLQLVSLYQEGEGGFYLVTQDSSGHAKGFPLTGGDGWFVMSVLHHPEVFSPGNDILQPYPLHIGAFDGGWQDAATIYRDWALKQPWVDHGRIDDRTDVPSWWRESGLTLHLESYNDWGVEEISMPQGKAVVEFLDNQLGSPFTVRWRGGFQVLRPNEIIEFTDFAHRRNASVLYHTNGRLDFGLADPILNSAATLDWQGIPYTEDNPYWTGTIMCPASDILRNHLANQWSTVLDHGADGVYVDQIAVSPWVPCFDTTHGHEPGQTGAWWVEEQHSLQRDAVQSLDPLHSMALWSSEMQGELYLPLYSSSLSWQVGVETLFGMRFADAARFIPLFQFVYGEYTAPFGADSPLTDWTVESPILDYNLAYDFITGKCPGVFHNPGGNFDIDRLDTPTFDYLLSLAELRAGLLNAFLYGGRLLKDPSIGVGRVSVAFENLVGEEYRIHNTTRVLYSTWKAPDDRAAVILTNWQSQSNPVSITVSPQDLESNDGTPLLLFEGEGVRVLDAAWSGIKTVEITLPPRSVVALVADPDYRAIMRPGPIKPKTPRRAARRP